MAVSILLHWDEIVQNLLDAILIAFMCKKLHGESCRYWICHILIIRKCSFIYNFRIEIINQLRIMKLFIFNNSWFILSYEQVSKYILYNCKHSDDGFKPDTSHLKNRKSIQCKLFRNTIRYKRNMMNSKWLSLDIYVCTIHTTTCIFI